jgi:hypothetical protein
VLTSLRQKIRRAFLLRRAVRLVWQCAPAWTLASLALLVVQGLLPLASLCLLKLVVDSVTVRLASPSQAAAFGPVLLLIAGLEQVAQSSLSLVALSVLLISLHWSLALILLAAADQAIAAAAHASGADALVDRLPQGYATPLGKWFEEGTELSVGDWQKIALARAFLRPAQIMVLDEPTSALDAAAEYEVFQKFRQLTQGRAAVLISHRFSTVRQADCIYVLQEGRIAEAGAHTELIRRGGQYARLFELQAGNYR